MANQAHSAVVYGIDLGKTWFHVAGCDATGRSLHKVKLSRSRVFPFFANTSVALIGMEACPGSQWLARRLQALAPKGWLHARLTVQQPDRQGFGLAGSGVFLFNPPYTLHDQLRDALPFLTDVLGQYDGAHFLLEQRAS